MEIGRCVSQAGSLSGRVSHEFRGDGCAADGVWPYRATEGLEPQCTIKPGKRINGCHAVVKVKAAVTSCAPPA